MKYVLLCILLGGAALAAPRQDEFERAAAQLIFNTTHLRSDVGEPDARAVADYRRNAGSEAGSGFFSGERAVEDDDGRPYRWSLRVEHHADGWDPDPASEAALAEHHVPGALAGDAQVYFAVDPRAGSPRTLVAIRVVRGEVKLSLLDKRWESLSQAEHLERARERWDFALAEAERLDVFRGLPAEALVLVRAGAWNGAASLGAGALFSFDAPLDQTVELALTVTVAPDDPTLRLDAEGAREVELLYAGRALRLAADGAYALPLAADRATVDLVARFRPVPREGRVALGQVATLTLRRAGGPATITLQRSDWIPVVRRFELVEVTPALAEQQLPKLSDTWPETGWQRETYRKLPAWQVESWTELARAAALRPGRDLESPAGQLAATAPPAVFGANEPVLAGWGLRRDQWTFERRELRASEAPPVRELCWPSGKPLAVRVDLWIARDPAPGTGPALLADAGAEQRALRERLILEEYYLELPRVTPDFAGTLPDDSDLRRSRELAKLQDLMRLAAWSEPLGGRHAPNILRIQPALGGARPLAAQEELLPIDAAGLSPAFTLWRPGVYEVRLVLALRDARGARKQVRTALRVNVVPPGFELRR